MVKVERTHIFFGKMVCMFLDRSHVIKLTNFVRELCTFGEILPVYTEQTWKATPKSMNITDGTLSKCQVTRTPAYIAFDLQHLCLSNDFQTI